MTATIIADKPPVARATTTFEDNTIEMIRYENGAIAFKEGGAYGNWIYFYPEQIAVMAAFIGRAA